MRSRIGNIAVLATIALLGTMAIPARPSDENPARPLNTLVLLGEWFGDAYFPLAKEIEARGWTMKRVGIDAEYRGCYNKARDIVLLSDILIPDLKDLKGYDCLIIPSGPQFRKFQENPVVLDFVRRAHASGLLVASFCVGNFLVQAAGLVDGLAGQETFPKEMTLAREGVLIGPRGGGPPPGDGYESAPIKALCDAVAREIARKSGIAAIEESIRAAIGWAKDKDFGLLYRTIADDPEFLEVHPDGAVVKGIADFKKAETTWRSSVFKAVRYDIRDLRIRVARSGEVAWFFCILDDINEWKGRPANWVNTRWTGVLEKRDGRWVVVQQHFSSAAPEQK